MLMKILKFLFCQILLVYSSQLQAFDRDNTRHLYGTNPPETVYEKALVAHAADSFERAMKKESKLSDNLEFNDDRSCNSIYGSVQYYHLLNNVCSLENASHLHIGLLTGGSFVSALYGNQDLLDKKIGVDIEDNHTSRVAYKKYLKDDYQIVIADCFRLDKSIFDKSIDIYLYDAGHTEDDHKRAFTYYDEIMADVFIAVIDDWACSWIRKGTFDAFDQLGYQILYENEVPYGLDIGNGQYVAVIRR